MKTLVFPRWLVRALLVTVLLPATAVLAAPTITLRQVAQSFSLPVELVNARDGSGRLFIVEQGGRIRILHNGIVASTAFLDLSGSGLITSGGERGLLGLAFHPQYASNGAFYIFYTRSGDGALTVARYLRDAGNPNLANPASGQPILTIPHPSSNHNGGHMVFGPDGYLYIGTGDGGGSGDPNRNGQNRGKLLGKLLRIAVDGGTSYTIPATNPYAGGTCAGGNCPEIWAYGLRNPWKFSFDRLTGDLLIGDVGQGDVEEVDFQPAGAAGGTNYGWGVREGNDCYNDDYFGMSGACATLTGDVRPILTYEHNSSGGQSITGGFRYRGNASPALQGYYIYADYVSRRVWLARPDTGGAWTTTLALPPSSSISSISSFGEDEAGELYLVDYGNGKIWAIDGPALGLVAMTSRKMHAAIGTFDLDLGQPVPVDGAVPVEPRAECDGHLLVFRFSATVTSIGTVAVTTRGGSPLPFTQTIAGNELRIGIPGIADNSRVAVNIRNVNGAGLEITAGMGFLLGDVTGSRMITASDISATKARQGAPVNGINHRFDLNCSGAIDIAEIGIVKAKTAGRLD